MSTLLEEMRALDRELFTSSASEQQQPSSDFNTASSQPNGSSPLQPSRASQSAEQSTGVAAPNQADGADPNALASEEGPSQPVGEKRKRQVPRLDENLLFSAKGIPSIEKYFAKEIRLKGTEGSEVRLSCTLPYF